MNIGARVELNDGEKLLCEAIAKARHDNNRSQGVRDAKRGGQSNYVTDLEGIASEVAFCRLFNVYPDFSIHIRSAQKGEDHGDAVLDGVTIDIKSTKYKNGKLIAVPWKLPEVDYFALMVGTFPSYEFRGFMHRDEFLREERLGDLGYGPTYIAEQSELQSFLLTEAPA